VQQGQYPTQHGQYTVQQGTALPSIVECYTTWCPACRRFDPIFQKAAKRFTGKILFRRINAEDPASKRFVSEHPLKGYPTLFFFDSQGRQVNMFPGATRTLVDLEVVIAKTFPAFMPELLPELQKSGKIQ
jgi:thiol-disulfide isomerase/thioredoxin